MEALLRSSDALIAPDWPAPPGVRAFATTRRIPGASMPPYDAFNLGLRCGDDAAAVQANRASLVRRYALPSAPHWLRQVHGARAIALDEAAGDDTAEPEADAAATHRRGVVLSILSADCLPVLLCSDDGAAVGAAHAGWRGLAAGVIENCVRQMAVPAQRLVAWLGPAIGPGSYEVGDEVRAAFVAHAPAASAAFAATRPGHWLCDLYTLARQRLAASGVTRTHGGGFDTFADPRLYSHRRDGARSGRLASVIWIS